MKRTAYTWIAFGWCAAIVFAAMGWMTATMLRLERAETDAREQARGEESVRLALWRMDSGLTALLARESARPSFAYASAPPMVWTDPRGSDEAQDKEPRMPSPWLTAPSRHVALYFQFQPDGTLTSPQVPHAPSAPHTEANGVAPVPVEKSRKDLAALAQRLTGAGLAQALEQNQGRPILLDAEDSATRGASAPEAEIQSTLNANEFTNRIQQVASNTSIPIDNPSASGAFLGATETALRPVWIEGELYLARRVAVGGRNYLQGCWLDWSALREELLAGVKDLLPQANLVRADAASGAADPGRLLASLPLRLEPGPLPPPIDEGLSPVRLALLVGWISAIAAAGAVAGLLQGALSLSERRGAFVSAVTHELRTPLTTFRMYTEMLAEGRVTDESKRQRYHETLHAEASRLTHLVENVLAYARLERRPRRHPLEALAVAALLGRSEGRLRQRAEQAGMTLIVDAEAELLLRELHTDPLAVEQILMNLVDNACKYAGGRRTDESQANRELHLAVKHANTTLRLRLSDQGPGIRAADARRLFRPFSKSARAAAESAPGIGLGLALSRRLARSLGGDLRHVATEERGACFELSLPLG